MKKLINVLLAFCFFLIQCTNLFGQKTIRILPKEIDEVLINPGIGFMTFQRFNGDSLNSGLTWTEGLPIVYQEYDDNQDYKDYPLTSIAYFRVYWRYLEPEMGQYDWSLIDMALETARKRHQTLMLRIAPYGSGPVNNNTDVPEWYRSMVGSKNEWVPENYGFDFEKGEGWRVDAEDPRYAFYYGRMITELGKRYDGHPDMESVDLSIVGHWGEGKGAEILNQKTREALVNAYTDNFKKTPLIMLLTDETTNKYGLLKANVGWRVDCLGDMGGFMPCWSHMLDYYPDAIINYGMQDAWKKGPVSMEICWVMQKWKNDGWDIDYIINQSLKWHISSFNAKSSAVPEEWWPSVNKWLKMMGYRFVLRKFSYPESVSPNEELTFKSWWENKGVAPCYKDFKLAIRLKSEFNVKIFITDANIKEWLPGDIVYNNAFTIPSGFPPGLYDVQIAIVDKLNFNPVINLAIEGKDFEGWYQLGKINVTK